MNARWERITDLAEQALRLAEPERASFLRAASEGDEELQRRVEALIQAGLAEDGFLDPIVGSPEMRQGLVPGMRIGPFRIVREIGEGGMGLVFAADQDAPRRRVALKVMRDGLMTPARRRRFRYEVETLGALNHPGIAQIFQAGIHRDVTGAMPRDLPWFAMEYVKGASTLSEYAQRNALGIEERLRLFVRICDAVHHGHQKGVIHRDLKPENLLIDPAGNPKIIDFGVARTTDAERVMQTLRTQAREIVGTLPYMSPEQARGEPADVRSDVYGLGAILYEWLTGSLPVAVEGNDFLGSARRIVDEPPRRPSLYRPELKGDLEAVLLKALEKDPGRRYASAEALAADLRRILRREPVDARVPTAWDQWRLFARRNRPLVLAAAAVGVVLVGATLVSLRYAFTSRRAEARADQRTREADAERRRAARLFERSLERGLATTNTVTPRVHALPGGAAVAADLMEANVADLEELESSAGDDPLVLLALAAAYLRFGDVYGNPVVANLGNPEKAVAAYTRAIALAERALPGERRAVAARTIARALRLRCEVRQMAGYDEDTQEDLSRALAVLEEAVLEAEGEDAARGQFELGLIHHLRSVDAKGRKDLAAAEAHAREALDHLEVFSASPFRHLDDADRHLAAKAYWLGVVLLARERIGDACAAFERAVAIVARLPEDRQQRLDRSLYLFGLGAAERRRGDFSAADEHLRLCREGFAALREEDPKDQRILPHLIASSLDWVYAGDRQSTAPDRAATAEGRRRARAAAEQLRALAPESKIVAMYAKRLEAYAAPR